MSDNLTHGCCEERPNSEPTAAHTSPRDGQECYCPVIRGAGVICGAKVESSTRCPDGNPACDGTDLLHGSWCRKEIPLDIAEKIINGDI